MTLTLRRSHPDPLQDSPLFARLSHRLLAQVNTLSTPVTFPAGAVLFHEGDVGREAFVVLTGEVAVNRAGTEIARVGAGGLLGEGALLGDGRRTATGIAVEPVTAIVMSPREFASVLRLPGVDAEVRRIADARHAAA